MRRRKTEYRESFAAETDCVVSAATPLTIPPGMPATVEVGMGAGALLVARAAAEPERLFVGVETKAERAWQALRAARAKGARNVRFIALEAVKADLLIPTAAFDELLVLFPDPWPARRDAKHRLIGPRFLKLYGRWLKPGASGRFRTDSAVLFAFAKESLAASGWKVLSSEADMPAPEVQTKFETLWRARGGAIREVRFERPATLPEDARVDASADRSAS